MPPKKGGDKSVEKAKQKLVEDKTFGLKNKNKSKAVQKHIRNVQGQVTGHTKSEAQIATEEHAKKEAKKAAMKQQAQLQAVIKTMESLKAESGAKKNAQIIKEEQQIDLYVDQRTQMGTIDEWDTAALEDVVNRRHGDHQAKTDIVCKYFYEALERRIYGWFWQCPNGNACQYKHCLPPGYQLKPKETPVESTKIGEEEVSLEERIELERSLLPSGGTPVTLESFTAWKNKQLIIKEEAASAAAHARGKLSGKDLFAFNPNIFIDDADAMDDSNAYAPDEEYWNAKQVDEDDLE